MVWLPLLVSLAWQRVGFGGGRRHVRLVGLGDKSPSTMRNGSPRVLIYLSTPSDRTSGRLRASDCSGIAVGRGLGCI